MALAALAAASAAAVQPGGGTNGQWIAVPTERDGELSYDAGSVRRTGPLIRFRLRIVPPPATGDSSPMIAAMEFDCGNRTLAFLSVERFDASGASRGIRTVDSPRRQPIYRDQPEANFYRRLCPPSLARPLPTPPPMPMIQVVPPPVRLPPPVPPAPPPPPPPPPPGRTARAQWQMPPHALLTSRDYPASALRAEEQGRTLVRLAVTRRGRVSDCTIVRSSGSAALDGATCRILQERARFRPARDARGRAVADQVVTAIAWQIPD